MKFAPRLFTYILALTLPLATHANTLNIYLDADQSNNSDSGKSILMGIGTALSEINHKIGNTRIQVHTKDHHGNTLRTKRHLEVFLQDEDALAVFGGLHSPNLIHNKNFINENSILTFVPWAAAGPITRSENNNNWVYRLSIDDSLAGNLLVKHAVETKSCTQIGLLLENTAWGNSNEKTLTAALETYKLKPASVKKFPWNINVSDARHIIKDTLKNNVDCLIFVGNTPEGISIFKALSELKENKPSLISHWGITGGSFDKEVTPYNPEVLDLSFIQTCFSFLDTPLHETGKQAWESLTSKNPSIKKYEDLRAPTGFIHAYDLTKILIAALNKADLSKPAKNIATQVKQIIETEDLNINGLVKNYSVPFSTYSKENNPRGHEALSLKDFCMAKYTENGAIKLIK